MNDVAASGSLIAADTRKALEHIRTQPASYSPTTFAESHATLRKQIEDEQQDVSIRTAALRALTEQVSHGLAAIRAAQLLPSTSAEFVRSIETYLRDLMRQLEQ